MESMTPKPEEPNEWLTGIKEDDVQELTSFYDEIAAIHDVMLRWKQVVKIKEEFDAD